MVMPPRIPAPDQVDDRDSRSGHRPVRRRHLALDLAVRGRLPPRGCDRSASSACPGSAEPCPRSAPSPPAPARRAPPPVVPQPRRPPRRPHLHRQMAGSGGQDGVVTGQDGVVTPPREWDAVAYDALPLPHERWGRGVLERLPLRGNERVLDVGAGTGRDTAALLQRLPRGHVVAVDASERMLTRLRARLPA